LERRQKIFSIIYDFISYLTGNILLLGYKDEEMNAVSKNTPSLL
jgi:hypothetical protein